MRLGKCSRTGDIIEPMLKPQWWVDCSGMAKRAADAVREFKPKTVCPYHYRGSDTAKFKKLVGDASEVSLRDWYGK